MVLSFSYASIYKTKEIGKGEDFTFNDELTNFGRLYPGKNAKILETKKDDDHSSPFYS